MSSNSEVLQDWEGDFPDWIELYNAGSEEINLEGFTLSDDLNEPYLWNFPSVTLAPDSFLIVFASKKDTIVSNEIHSNFKINQQGEDLILSSPDGILLHHIQAVFVPENYTYSCIPDGNKNYMNESYPSPLSPNMEIFSVSSSHVSGFYENGINLELSSSNPNTEIRYTLNGSIPHMSSKKYENAIHLANDNHTAAEISQIPTTPLEGPWPLPTFIWKEPGDVQKAHIIRYALFYEGELKSKIYTQSFFVGRDLSDKYSFPVFSLVTDSLNLFQYDTGIYIPGIKFEEIGWQWFPYGNYRERGRDWERLSHICFFEENGSLTFESSSGIRIRGSGSTCNPQKSLGIYFRSEYGLKKIRHKIFKDSEVDEFKRLILRSSGNDMLQTHFRDAVLTELLKPLDLELQNFRPAILFINGEYWGIHGIREKFDEFYFKYHFGIPEEELSILGIAMEAEEGEDINYREIHNYVSTHDMSTAESYQYIDERVDIANMIDFLVTEIYYANYDWPCNNYKKWRTTDENSKWRFLIHDLDLSFGFHGDSQWNKESLTHAFFNGEDWPNCGASNQLFRGMLENERFVDEFIQRFEWHMNHTFKSSRIVNKIEEFRTLFEPEILEHIERWGHPYNYEEWLNEIDVMIDFAKKRPCFMKEHIMDYFQLEDFDFDCDSLNNYDLHAYTSKDFQIYPNPVKYQEIRIHSEIPGSHSFSYDLYTSDGKLLNKGRLQAWSTKISLDNLVSGMYILKIYNPDYRFRYKIVKMD